MARKHDTVLTRVSQGTGSWLEETSPLSRDNRELSRDERFIQTEFHKQEFVIELTEQKTIFGMRKIAELHQHASTIFDETSSFIFSIKTQARSKEHQLYIDTFTKHQLEALGKHLLGCVEVGATNIGIEIHRTLYLIPEEERRSFLQRLFGRS